MVKSRQVAVAVPLVLPWLLSPTDMKALEIPSELVHGNEQGQAAYLVCTSRKHKHKYLLPKGGIEHGEDASAAALREGWVSLVTIH